MLEIENVVAGYDSSQVLFEMSFGIAERQVASLIGRNGMGKSTTIKTLMGMLPVRSGSVRFEGTSIENLAPHRIARMGIGLVPEARRVFASLSVEENLVATSRGARAAANSHSGEARSRPIESWTLPRVYALFPRLQERRAQSARTLSGGEQQMLAIGRALMTNPRLLVLDEATEGLAPLIRVEIWNCLHRLKQAGQTILVIDKNLKEMAALVDVHHVVEKGRVVWKGGPAELDADAEVSRRYLGV